MGKLNAAGIVLRIKVREKINNMTQNELMLIDKVIREDLEKK